MARNTSRREFLQTTAAVAGVGYFSSLAAAESTSPNEVIRYACIGIGGKGDSDSGDAANNGDIVAICDINDRELERAANNRRFKVAKPYNDFRKMLEEVGKDVDAVTVSTPDHTHAPAAAMAMNLGKHCFCQKPLTHDIFEARRLSEIAREKKVATQMGNQGTAESGLRKAAAIVKSGALGDIKEVHVWTNRPIWAQGGDRPETKPVPPNIHWDLFLGTAPFRPFADGYHSFAWRGWWDFGTGALGDMACHTFNMPYMAVDLKDPVSVQAVTSGHNKDSYPKRSMITFEFPANENRGPVKVVWYDGGNRPPKEVYDGGDGSGSMIIGTKGKLRGLGDYNGNYELHGVDEPANVEFEKSPGHFNEWVRAIRGGQPARSNFVDYAGGLTETILLGNLAVYAASEPNVPGKKVEWDAKNLKATNAPELAHIVKREYRGDYRL
ncbi:MAG: Gfo/Idh/MocA family oxidoreductase [Planctomycetota bacterium]|nr:Gfo/Idh/MocA family oxidoreductase [Planctomycetota bacterium]